MTGLEKGGGCARSGTRRYASERVVKHLHASLLSVLLIMSALSKQGVDRRLATFVFFSFPNVAQGDDIASEEHPIQAGRVEQAQGIDFYYSTVGDCLSSAVGTRGALSEITVWWPHLYLQALPLDGREGSKLELRALYEC